MGGAYANLLWLLLFFYAGAGVLAVCDGTLCNLTPVFTIHPIAYTGPSTSLDVFNTSHLGSTEYSYFCPKLLCGLSASPVLIDIVWSV